MRQPQPHQHSGPVPPTNQAVADRPIDPAAVAESYEADARQADAAGDGARAEKYRRMLRLILMQPIGPGVGR